jgi:hypothetical protein
VQELPRDKQPELPIAEPTDEEVDEQYYKEYNSGKYWLAATGKNPIREQIRQARREQALSSYANKERTRQTYNANLAKKNLRSEQETPKSQY